VSVQRSQSSIKRGQSAAYVVQVSTVGGSASNVSVALTASPSSQKPEFTSGCTKGDGTASCALSSVTVKAPATLHAQVAVASNASSVSSVKLTATASIVTTTKWTPPAADETVDVTSATASPTASSAGASPKVVNLPPVPLGPIPDLNGESSKLIGPGNAASLFPTITPSATPQPTAGNQPQPSKRNPDPVSTSAALPAGTPVLTAQVAGLIALGLAIILTVARLSLRRRSRSSGPSS
jgi:hypothetical protein